jgi:hypothetical protein
MENGSVVPREEEVHPMMPDHSRGLPRTSTIAGAPLRKRINRALVAAAALLGVLSFAAPARASVVPDKICSEDCHEVLAFISHVPRENAEVYVPKEYRVTDPEQTPGERDAEVVIRAAECKRVTIEGTSRPTRYAEVRITLDRPAGATSDFNWYELSWATDNRALVRWAKAGTGMDGAVRYSDQLEYRFGLEPDLFVGAPEPAAWAFTITARAPRAAGTPGIDKLFTVNLWRETDAGTAWFERVPDDVLVAAGEAVIETPPGSKLAQLLGRTSVQVGTPDQPFLSNTIGSERQTKDVK